MTVNAAVRHLQSDLKHLRSAKQELRNDKKDLRADRKELGKDRAELKRDLAAGDKLHKSLDTNRTELAAAQSGRQSASAALDAERAAILARYNGDAFEAAPELTMLDTLGGQVLGQFDSMIASEKSQIAADQAGIAGKRAEIKKDRAEIKHDGKVIDHDRKELVHDRKDIKADRRRALDDLRPAEYHMGLKATNQARRELGLKAVDHVIRPVGPGNVTATMRRLASAARSTALSMGGYHGLGYCATGVSRAIRSAMGLGVYGDGNDIDNNLPRSKFKQVHIPLSQALKIPGCVLTWEHTSTSLGSIYGHTAITLGDGHSSASDFIETNTLAGNASRTGLKIFMPIV